MDSSAFMYTMICRRKYMLLCPDVSGFAHSRYASCNKELKNDMQAVHVFVPSQKLIPMTVYNLQEYRFNL